MCIKLLVSKLLIHVSLSVWNWDVYTNIYIHFQDVIGEALDRVGTYNNLDNTEQVVALIDEVSL